MLNYTILKLKVTGHQKYHKEKEKTNHIIGKKQARKIVLKRNNPMKKWPEKNISQKKESECPSY